MIAPMRKSLRVPAMLAMVVGTSAAIAVGCGGDDDPPPVDAAVTCDEYCVPIGSDDSNCPNRTVCVSPQGTCPAGCEPEPVV